jgi:nitrogen-specific signal transduction histidine kinase
LISDAQHIHPEAIMEKNDIYQALEDDFTSTFIRELLPGVLHNFANPLNGIMGRSKLLQRRIDDTFKKISDKYPETAADLQDELQRIKNDILSVNKESESFFEMFRDASGKFYALAARGEDRIDFSQLLAAEMRFANFYLEFKHEITKSVQYDSDLPDFKGNTAEFSLVFWRLIRFAMTRALNSENKEFYLTTQHDHDNIIILIKHSGDAVPEDAGNIIVQYLQDGRADMTAANMEKGVLLALVILKKYSAGVHFSTEGSLSTICVTMPYRVSAR